MDTSSRQWLPKLILEHVEYIHDRETLYYVRGTAMSQWKWRCEGDTARRCLHDLQAQDQSWDITRYARNYTINEEQGQDLRRSEFGCGTEFMWM